MQEGGYYSSKKTDDICEDVCGPVTSLLFPFVFQFFSIVFMADLLLFWFFGV